MILQADQVTGNQRKQVARFGEGVLPLGKVPSVRQFTSVDQVAVTEQYRVFFLCFNSHLKRSHHIRTVGVVGDFAKAMRFALGTKISVRQVEAIQGGIPRRINLRIHFKQKLFRHHRDNQTVLVQLILLLSNRLPVNFQSEQLHRFAIKTQRFGLPIAIRVQEDLHLRINARCLILQGKPQAYLFDQVGGRFVVFQVDRFGGFIITGHGIFVGKSHGICEQCYRSSDNPKMIAFSGGKRKGISASFSPPFPGNAPHQTPVWYCDCRLPS